MWIKVMEVTLLCTLLLPTPIVLASVNSRVQTTGWTGKHHVDIKMHTRRHGAVILAFAVADKKQK